MFRWLKSLFAPAIPVMSLIPQYEQLLIAIVLAHGKKNGTGWIYLEVPKEALEPEEQNVLLMFSRTGSGVTISVTDKDKDEEAWPTKKV